VLTKKALEDQGLLLLFLAEGVTAMKQSIKIQ
jgi:hypothetical protein